MVKGRYRLGVFIAGLCLACLAQAASIEKQIRLATRYASMEQVYSEMENSLALALDEVEGQMEREQYQTLRKGMNQGFDTAAISQDVESHLAQNYKQSNYEKLESIWESGFGQMVYGDRKQLDEHWLVVDILTLQRSPQSRLLDYAEELKNHPPSQRRIELIRQLLMATPDLELHMALRRELTRALLLSAAQFSSDSSQSLQSIDRHLEDMRPKWLEETASLIVLSYFYIYREHSDRELQQVVYFYQQPTMQWFRQQLVQAFTLALEKGGRRAAGYVKSRSQT